MSILGSCKCRMPNIVTSNVLFHDVLLIDFLYKKCCYLRKMK